MTHRLCSYITASSTKTSHSISSANGTNQEESNQRFNCVYTQQPNRHTITNQEASSNSKPQAEIETLADVPPVVPIPAYLVYDAFNEEIDAIVVYERLMIATDLMLPQTFPNTRYLLRNFTKAQVVTPTKNSPQTKLKPSVVFLDSPPPQVNQWKSTVIPQFLPTVNLQQATLTTTNHHKSSNTPTSSSALSSSPTPPPSYNTSTSTTTPIDNQTQTPTSTIMNNNDEADNLTAAPSTVTQVGNPNYIAAALNRLAIDPPLPTVHILRPTSTLQPHLQSPLPSEPTTPQPETQPTNIMPPTNNILLNRNTPPSFNQPSSQQQNQLLEQTAAIVMQAMQAFEDMKAKQRTSANTTANSSERNPFLLTANNNNELNIPQFSYDRLMNQCGIAPREEDGIPHFHRVLAIPGLSKAERKSVIKKVFTEQVWYREAKVRPYTTLVSMIDKRDFKEETIGSTCRSAAKGLTIFAVPTMSDLDYNKINDTAEALEKATTTTVRDISSSSFQAESPKTFAQLLTLIKRFVNVLFGVFGKFCPLLLELDKIIKFLEEYGDTAISRMTRNTSVWPQYPGSSICNPAILVQNLYVISQ